MSVPKAVLDIAKVIKAEIDLSPERDSYVVISLDNFRDEAGVFVGKSILDKVLRRLQELQILKSTNLSDLYNHILPLQSDKVEVEVDRKRLADFLDKEIPEGIDAISKSAGGSIKFVDKEAILIMGDKKCSLPPYKNEHFLCRAMFKHAKGKPVDWSEVYEMITGYYTDSYGKPPKTKENYHSVYDPVQQINERVKKDLGIEKLFDWREMTITRLL